MRIFVTRLYGNLFRLFQSCPYDYHTNGARVCATGVVGILTLIQHHLLVEMSGFLRMDHHLPRPNRSLRPHLISPNVHRLRQSCHTGGQRRRHQEARHGGIPLQHGADLPRNGGQRPPAGRPEQDQLPPIQAAMLLRPSRPATRPHLANTN